MSSVIIAGNTSGTITLDAPAVAGTTTLTLPTTTDTLVGRTTTDTLTNKTLTSPVMAGTPTGVGVLTAGTAVASTSGTSIDFTSIPSWVKRITIIMSGMSTNGTSNQLFQIGSGSVTTSGYQCITGSTGYTAGFGIPEASATRVTFGGIVLTNISGNIWVAFGSVGTTTGATQVMVGGVTLGGVLDRVRATTVNGTDAFDAGSINIMYE
jgi:hypothetical protein